MKVFKLSLLMVSLVTSVFSANAYDKSQVTDVMFKTEPSLPLCSFDRQMSKSKRVDSHTIMGSFSVNCQEESSPYRLTTSLSPLAKITIEDGTKYKLKWYLKNDGVACYGDKIDPQSVNFHSGNRTNELIGDNNKNAWTYCLKLEPVGKDTITARSAWPLQGMLQMEALSATQPFVLPSNASRIYVRFEHNKSTIDSDMKGLIDDLMMNIGDPTNYQVQIHAHTSSIGSQQYNQELSLVRLMRVRNYLTENYNIDKKDTWGQAWGEERPTAIQTFEDEPTLNRRVDVLFLPKNTFKERKVVVNKIKKQ